MYKKSITFVNRHYPPNLNVTGENVWDISRYLIENHGIDVYIVHVDRDYTGGGYKRQPIGKVHKVWTIYAGDNKYLRNLASLWDGYFLIKKAMFLNRGPIIVLTSPPLLPMWASLLLKNKWIMWSMDLFPEGFGVINKLKQDGWFYKHSYKKTYANAPEKLIALGPGQQNNLEEKFRTKIATTILPCGVFVTNEETKISPAWKKEDKIMIGYCGNIGIPHNPQFVKAAIDAISPDKHHMILVAYGVFADEVKQYAQGKAGITILDNVPRNQLGFIDVHLVTLLPTWTHVAVPSKAVSSVCSGSTILFCGNQESDNWQLLKDAAWFVKDDEAMKENVKNVLSNISITEIGEKRKNSILVTQKLNSMVKQAYDEIASWAK